MYKNINPKDWTNKMSQKIKKIIKHRTIKNEKKYKKGIDVMQPK